MGKRTRDYQASEQKPSQIGSEQKKAANTESEKSLHPFVNEHRETIPEATQPEGSEKGSGQSSAGLGTSTEGRKSVELKVRNGGGVAKPDRRIGNNVRFWAEEQSTRHGGCQKSNTLNWDPFGNQ